MKLVTIVCEALARQPLQTLLHEVGAHGYTLFTVEGSGARGHRAADIEEFANIQVEVVVPPEVAEKLLTPWEKHFFPRYAMVAHESDGRVLRPHMLWSSRATVPPRQRDSRETLRIKLTVASELPISGPGGRG